RQRDDLRGAPLGLDLLLGGLREVMRLHRQLLRHLAGAENAHAVRRALGEAGLLERFGVNGVAVLECLVEIADIHDVILLVPAFVGEAALGNAAEERHLAAFERERGLLGAGAGVLALAAARRRLAVARARPAADALLAPTRRDAMMYGGQVHR